jgi:hypothetical protein
MVLRENVASQYDHIRRHVGWLKVTELDVEIRHYSNAHTQTPAMNPAPNAALVFRGVHGEASGRRRCHNDPQLMDSCEREHGAPKAKGDAASNHAGGGQESFTALPDVSHNPPQLAH